MKKKRLFSLMMAGALGLSMGTTAYASAIDGEIANIQAEQQAAQSELAQTQSSIADMESKKQELENYLAQLNTQYEELTEAIAQLSVEAGEKEEELKVLQSDLEKAKAAAQKQYEAMKIRIVYMYERGETTTLETLLSSKSFADFLNRAENIMQISSYDRNMLKKYEELQKQINEQEAKVEEEVSSIDSLMAERSAKQQEVQTLVSSTSDNISSYVAQISASQEEASVLMAQISSAQGSISALIRQAEEEKAAQAAAEAAAAETESVSYDDYGYNPEEDTTESFSSSTSTDIIVEEVDDSGVSYEEAASTGASEETYEESYEESYEEETEASSDSGQGTYLGNFTLTAYCNCAQCCGTAGNLTASGTVPTAGCTVAMAGVPFGTQLLINGNVYTVEDLGTPYGHVDIYFGSHSEALSFGLQYADVYQLN